ncbi:alpha-mannosidase [Sporobolomyces koalae]|uniref:alpha-mannosidase n=1 Tax=Sporobolomyces koalae TaxID=500713 RepID=UPI00316C3DF9
MASAVPRDPYPRFDTSGPRPPHFRGLTLGRLDQFEGKISEVLFEHRIDDREHVQIELWSSPGKEKTPFEEVIRKPFKSVEKGVLLGPSWTNHWFRVTLKVPESWAKAERVQLEFDPSCEGCVFDTEGCPLQGLTGGYDNLRRVEFILPKDKRASTYKYYIEVSCNAMFGNGMGETNGPPDNNRYFRLNSADLVVPRMDAWHLLWDFRCIKDLARTLPERSPLGNKCLETGNDIMNAFDSHDLSSIAKCRKLAEHVFGKKWQELEDKVYSQGEDSKVDSWGIGNCHIDTAWLWTFAQTRQKTARSWSTQLDLMERYPEHRFVASQAQQFAWLEKDYPQLFNKIRAKVHDGNFIPIGGMWVESDQLLPSGESLVRQLLFGQRYFHSRFGSYCRTFWLPDSFGYNAQIPQLARLAGCDYFFTQKISWNQFNDFPLTSFRWKGQDGTQIVCHFCPQNTYTAAASVDDVLNTWRGHKSLQASPAGLLTFGNGDGGGGPLAPMLENLRRCRAVANEAGEIPKVKMGTSVDEFYDNLVKTTDNGAKLPTWSGELYLELHRGTATSHGSIKRHNRKSEILLHDIEFIGTLASLLQAQNGGKFRKGGYRYPRDGLQPLWEDVLLCQFHDVLPGSAIGLVYEDAEKIYANVASKGLTLLSNALDALLPASVSIDSAASLSGSRDTLFGVSTTGLARRSLVKIPLATARALSDAAIQPSRTREDDESAYVVLEVGAEGGLIAHSKTSEQVHASGCGVRARKIEGDAILLYNDQVEVVVSSEGRLTSIYDKAADRDLLVPGETAGFVIFEDTPLNWDAWDVDAFHLETKKQVTASSVRVVEDGPLRASVEAVYHIGQSRMKCTISLDAFSPSLKSDALSLIQFDAKIDWHERHRFLKWEVPTTIAPTGDMAIFENQFGFTQRPVHRNTTWDRAKFESVAHRFCDVSEFGYGIALLNDCKYGHAVEGGTIRLSLLRAATIPDAEQDQGQHEFAFALYPHRSSFLDSDVVAVARHFNYPLHVRVAASSNEPIVAHATTLPISLAAGTSTRNVVLDTVKRGEEDHFGSSTSPAKYGSSVIVRLYESLGGRGRATVKVDLDAFDKGGLRVDKVTVCDLLERDLEEVKSIKSTTGQNSVEFPVTLRGFEVKTIKITFAAK